MSPSKKLATAETFSQNYRVFWVGRELKSLPWAQTPSTKRGGSEPSLSLNTYRDGASTAPLVRLRVTLTGKDVLCSPSSTLQLKQTKVF